ncbi:hypothetical protein EZS27_034882, partial [termite gut metagenome]
DAKLYRMWYSGGEQYEPNAISYATSKDGLAWEKYRTNPIFSADKQTKWEQERAVGGGVQAWRLVLYVLHWF